MMNLRRSRGGGGGCGGRIFHNNFLVKSLRGNDGDDDHQDDNGDQPSAVIGLLAGRYKLLAEGSSLPQHRQVSVDEENEEALNLHLPPLQLLKFEPTTVADELAEFRLLNHKDRVIIRALEGGGSKVLFGSKITEEKEEVGVKHYFSLEHQAVLVLRGPVTIHYHPHHHHHTTVQKALSTEEEEDEDEKKTEEVAEENDEDGDKEEQDEEKEADKEAVENLEQSGGDAIKASSSSSSPSSSSQTNSSSSSLQSTKYSGHVALSLMGAATIVVHPPPKVANSSSSPMEIFLPAGSKFSLDRAVPLRFQQKSIVQRQREQHQASHGLMALETFDHLIGGLF